MTKLFRCLLIVCVLAWAQVLRAEPTAPHLPKGWKFSLQPGDATAGKEAVRKLECYSCHRFPTGNFPEARSSGGVGPDLVPAVSNLPREYLAESIINPHKYIAGELVHYRGHEKVSSEMRDYSSLMTVRQLLDIVEFLKHLGDTPSAHP
jgi:hypothetical protein